MSVATATFETGVNGATVSSGDPGSLTAWTNVFTTGGAITYSNTHAYDLLSCKFVSTGGSHWLEWDGAFGSISNYFGRIYIWMDSTPSPTNFVFHRFWEGANEGGRILIVGGTGELRIASGAGATLGTTTAVVSTGQWVRIEWSVINSLTVGQIEAKLFNSPNSVTPTEVITSAATQNTRVTTDKAWFGPADPTDSGFTAYFDNIVEGAASYPGPVAVPSTAPQVLSMQSHVFGHGVW